MHSLKRGAYTVAMKLKDYVAERGVTATLARQIGAQPQLMWQWASGVRPVPIERCVAIEIATKGAVTRRDLRPDDWQKIWPELADSMADQALPSADRSLFAIKPDHPAPPQEPPAEPAPALEG